MLTTWTLRRINDRPRGINRLPLLAVGGVSAVLAALLYAMLALPLPTLAALLAGVLLVLGLYRTQKARTTISLSYEGRLDDEIQARFSSVSKAVEGLASSEKIWHLASDRPEQRVPRADGVCLQPERGPARVGLLETPGIRSDVPVWGIGAGDQRVLFFPEGVLFYDRDRYEPLSYALLGVSYSSVRFFEEEDVPGDAEVAERLWRFRREDGSPDHRISGNRQIAVVLYGLLKVVGPRGREVWLQVSDRRAAARFARAFGAADPAGEQVWDAEKNGETPGEERRYRSSGRQEGSGASSNGQGWAWRSAEVEAALRTLDLDEGASAQEIGAAYRRLARTYHPDKAAGESLEVRLFAEERMKEINAAYSELKHRGKDPAAVRAG